MELGIKLSFKDQVDCFLKVLGLFFVFFVFEKPFSRGILINQRKTSIVNIKRV